MSANFNLIASVLGYEKIRQTGKIMASTFKIFIHQNSDNLHLKLFGDFDDSSVQELVSILNAHYDDNGNIFIHTSSLFSIRLSGLNMFKNKFINELSGKLIFTGKYKKTMVEQINGLL